MAALYLHIPFCRSKCLYCDFYSETQLSLLQPFLQALAREMELVSPAWSDLTFSTIYFGGGTPSLLSPSSVASIVELLARRRTCARAEISLEANPGGRSHFAAFKRAGVHRLTIGVQSFDDADLQWLGRIHSAAEAVQAIRSAREAGFDDIGIDLIYGLPGQPLDRWTNTLRTAVRMRPEHISMYGLTWEHNTPLWHKLQKGEVHKCAEQVERDMFLTGIHLLREAGYEHYEISNFARPGFRSRHNSAYWDLSPFLGLGPSAHSFRDGRRWWNVRDLQKYIARLSEGVQPVEGEEQLTPAERARELILLGLRRCEGIDLAALSQLLQKDRSTLKKQLLTLFGNLDEIDPFERSQTDDLLTWRRDQLGLTQQGLLLYDSVCEKLFFLVNEETAVRQSRPV